MRSDELSQYAFGKVVNSDCGDVDPNACGRLSLAHILFSGGAKFCIGQNVAGMALRWEKGREVKTVAKPNPEGTETGPTSEGEGPGPLDR